MCTLIALRILSTLPLGSYTHGQAGRLLKAGPAKSGVQARWELEESGL